MIHRIAIYFSFIIRVVNCFQNPILEDDSQAVWDKIFTDLVVNCFQNPILEDDSQASFSRASLRSSCELLSESYFRG